jgi:hypothetical protein
MLLPFLVECAREHSRLAILEIGGGLGFLAQSLIREARRVLGGSIPIHYTVLDISKAFIAHQESMLRDTDADVHFVVGDAQRALDQESKFELVLANEVIADFETGRAKMKADSDDKNVLQHIGVEGLIHQLPGSLVPGGKALFIEYGGTDAPPERILHLNHAEYAIDFRAVAQYAKTCGFHVEMLPLRHALRVHDETEMLVGQQEAILCLNALLEKDGRSMEYRAYDRADFLRTVGDISADRQILGPVFAPMRAGLHFGPSLEQFIVLQLTWTSTR